MLASNAAEQGKDKELKQSELQEKIDRFCRIHGVDEDVARFELMGF